MFVLWLFHLSSRIIVDSLDLTYQYKYPTESPYVSFANIYTYLLADVIAFCCMFVFKKKGTFNEDKLQNVVDYQEYNPVTDQEESPDKTTFENITATEWISYDELDYKEDDEIGRGAYGVVYYGLWNEATEVAIKKCIAPTEFLDPISLQEFQREVVILSQLRHPNIVQYLGASQSPNADILVVMEYIPSGSLADKLKVRPDVPPPLIINTLKGIAAGMTYLHSRTPPLVHRDLKPHNLLIVGEYANVKIADFGSSRLFSESIVKTFSAGTIEYMAPEVIQKKGYTPKSDVYSVGVISWQMLSGKEPYTELAPELASLKRIKILTLPKLTATLPQLSQQDPFLAQLIVNCLSESPSERPSFAHIFKQLKARKRRSSPIQNHLHSI